MKITKLKIRNFRSIKSLDLELDDTTIFIGPNNVGKTAILDAVRIALTRRWGQRGTGFTEYDIYRPDQNSDPRALPPIIIEITLEEPEQHTWSDDMVQALDEIMVVSSTGKNMISLRVSCAWNADTESFEPSWEFLDPTGIPLSGKARRATNLTGFFGYLPIYWLSALRDADDQFSSRSNLWGRLLRSIRIPKELEDRVKTTLDGLDASLLAADPQLGKIADTVGKATEIAFGESSGAAKLRMLPLNISDLLSRAGIILRNEESRPWLPLDHHGQGLQSLSVIFLFKAAVVQQLAEDPLLGIEPIFAIEEPEAHLHPQAARTLYDQISALPGQKLVTTHSPYFVQHVPLHNIRSVRLQNGCTEVTFLPRRFVSTLPWNENVTKLASGSARMLERDVDTDCVASRAWFTDNIEGHLLNCWKGDPEPSRQNAIKDFRHSCRMLLSSAEENELFFTARRIRGEIFFARHWLLVEGPCEYLLLHALGQAFEWPLDQHGIAVIDFQNNGNASIYPALADAFGIPWHMVTDGDDESKKFRTQILKRGFNESDLIGHFDTLQPPNELEDQLLVDGHERLLRDLLAEIGCSNARNCKIEEFRGKLSNSKTGYMSLLAPKVAADSALAKKMPVKFVELVLKLKDGTL